MTKTDNNPQIFAVTGGTLTGNHGAEGMLRVVIEQLSQRFPDCIIYILTYYPHEDREVRFPNNCRIYSATPLRVVFDWLPSSIFHWFINRILNRKQNILPFMRILKADAVVDIAGVSFIDGREKYLPYNVLTLFPFIINYIPVFKLSQAIGPINSIWNRLASRIILPHITKIFARGDYTYSNLENSGITDLNFQHAADTAFMLPCNIASSKDEHVIGIVPSSLLLAKHPTYADDMAAIADWLINSGYEIKLISHSWRVGTIKGRNNDVVAAEEIRKRMKNRKSVSILGIGLFAIDLKEVISTCSLVLTSRFHGMIAALGTKTPVAVLGWSHKYAEVMNQFDLEGFCMKYDPGNLDNVKTLLQKTIDQREHIVIKIENHLPKVKASSEAQFAVMEKILVKQ